MARRRLLYQAKAKLGAHFQSYDIVGNRTHNGRKFHLLTVINEFTKVCLAIFVAWRLNSDDVLQHLTELFVRHWPLDRIRSENDAEFTANAVRAWLGQVGVKTLFIKPASPWENRYDERFNSKLRDELLNSEIFYTVKEAQVLIEHWRQHYNTVRLHNSLGSRAPAPQLTIPCPTVPAYAMLRSVQQGPYQWP